MSEEEVRELIENLSLEVENIEGDVVFEGGVVIRLMLEGVGISEVFLPE